VLLNYKISIERKVQVQAADGSLTTTRTVVATTYAGVKPKRGSERSQSNQTESPADYEFHLRRNGSIQADDVIIWNGSEWNIRFISDDGPRALYMMIEAERGVAV